MPKSPASPIHLDQTVREVMGLYPATRRIFARYGLDTCCGGNHSIGPAAVARGVAPEALLAELNAALRRA